MTEFEQRFSLLSDKRITEEIQAGNIIIDPFDPKSLGTASYDLRLGRYYYGHKSDISDAYSIYNPWSEEDVRKYWGEYQTAHKASEFFNKSGIPEGIWPDDEIIMVFPGELILCHTQEFIGYQNVGTSMMKARSSIGRSGLEICRCAGWGDVGYINRWTMEVANTINRPIPLVAGRRISQLAFFEVGQILGKDYTATGKYQTSADIEQIKITWTPDQMLPKMWKDREVSK